MGVNDSRQTGLDEAVQVGSTAAKVVEGAAKAGKITAAAANGAALGGPYGAAASVAIVAAKHGKKILLALLAILAIPLLFLMMLPTLISSFFGMNLINGMEDSRWGFLIAIFISVIISTVSWLILRHKRLL